jgi:hypothetical protein
MLDAGDAPVHVRTIERGAIMSDALREGQLNYEREQSEQKKHRINTGAIRWLKIIAIYVGVIAFCNLVGWVLNSNASGAYLLWVALPIVTAYFLICKAWGLFLWKKK